MSIWILIAAVAFSVLVGSPAQARETCVTCHPDVATEYDRGAHVGELGCTACHGGDPAVEDLAAHDQEKGYIGVPSRLQIPVLCGSCHADPTRMKAFGLATDQYSQYLTSGHGIGLLQGDSRVALCTDCHGTHRILPPDEPTSRVARQNIPATCGHCHSDRELMAQYDLSADQEAVFRRSVHGEALFVQEHPEAPTCATCHGAHGASAPEVGTVEQICGNCHRRTREFLDEGPHRHVAGQGKMSECASCHGDHDTAPPTRALFDTTCPDCHAPDSAALASAQKLKTLLGRAEESLQMAAGEMEQTKRRFPTVVRYRPRLRQARAYFIEALTVQHSVDVERTRDLTRSARSTSDEVWASVHGIGQRRQLRYLGLAAVWVFLLFTVCVAYLYKREKQRERRQHADEAERPR